MYTLGRNPRMKPRTNKQLLSVVLLVSLGAITFTLWVGHTMRARLPRSEKARAAPLQGLPQTFIWAWERPEHLGFIDPQQVGVAFLAKTIRLSGDTILVRPRLQPLTLPEATKLIAVIRIEPDAVTPLTLSSGQIESTVHEVLQVAGRPRIAAIQIDFDARTSERELYRQLLYKLREQLPSSTSLSMTALASWCAGDRWLSDLPVDEVVPMFFRLGIERNNFISRLQSETSTFAAPCDQSAGVSTDEVIPSPQNKRLYIFSPKPWTASSLKTALEIYSR